MELLGAKKYYHRGEADDATSLELVVEPWLEGLHQEMRAMWDQIRLFESQRLAEILKPCEDGDQGAQNNVKGEDGEKKSTQITFYGKISSIKLLNPSSAKKYENGKEVYHVSIEFPRKID